jgi:hypothetical protein
MLSDVLRDWHDFYVVMAAASGTLIGAMFVVASIGSGVLTSESASEIRAFVTPTIVHVSAVLLGCAVLVVPGLTWYSLGAITFAASLAGLGYSLSVWTKIRGRNLDRGDHAWYAHIPSSAYAILVLAAVALLLRAPAGLSLFAAVLMILLVVSIRNAWDLTLFIVGRNSSSR